MPVSPEFLSISLPLEDDEPLPSLQLAYEPLPSPEKRSKRKASKDLQRRRKNMPQPESLANSCLAESVQGKQLAPPEFESLGGWQEDPVAPGPNEPESFYNTYSAEVQEGSVGFYKIGKDLCVVQGWDNAREEGTVRGSRRRWDQTLTKNPTG